MRTSLLLLTLLLVQRNPNAQDWSLLVQTIGYT